MLFFSGVLWHWWEVEKSRAVRESGLSTVTINHADFYSSDEYSTINFYLHAKINFNHCSFHDESIEFNSIPSQYVMKMYKSKLRAQLTLFTAFKSYSKIIFEDCELASNIVIHSLSRTIVPKFSLYIYWGSVSDSIIHIQDSRATFTDINITRVKMLNVLLSNFEHSHDTKLVVHLENLTWENTDKGFMDLFKVISVNIDSSLLTASCHVCTLINVQGKGSINKNMSELMRLVVNVSYDVSTLYLVNTTLDVQGNLQDKINTRGNAIFLINNTLTIAGSVSFYVWNDFEAENLLIQCSTGQMVQRALGQKHVMYTCIMLCDEKTEYSLQAGKLIVSESVTGHIGDQFSLYFKSLKYKSAPLE